MSMDRALLLYLIAVTFLHRNGTGRLESKSAIDTSGLPTAYVSPLCSQQKQQTRGWR